MPMVYLLVEDRHIRITLGRDILPKRLKIIPDTIASLGGLAFSGYFLKLSVESVLQEIKSGSASPVAQVPTFIPLAVVALGTLLLCVGFLFRLVMVPKAKEKVLGAKESALVAAVKESRIGEIRDAS